MAQVPKRNLPPDSQRWGRWVEDRIREIQGETGVTRRNLQSVVKSTSVTFQEDAKNKSHVRERYDDVFYTHEPPPAPSGFEFETGPLAFRADWDGGFKDEPEEKEILRVSEIEIWGSREGAWESIDSEGVRRLATIAGHSGGSATARCPAGVWHVAAVAVSFQGQRSEPSEVFEIEVESSVDQEFIDELNSRLDDLQEELDDLEFEGLDELQEELDGLRSSLSETEKSLENFRYTTGLLDNPGFIPDETGVWGPGWVLDEGTGGHAEFVKPDDLEANAILLDSTGTNSVLVWNTRSIAVSPGDELYLSGWGKGNAFAYLYGVFRDRDGEIITSAAVFVALPVSDDWEYGEGSWTVPEGAATLEVAVALGGINLTKQIARITAALKVGADLIVDGAIEAKHVDAESVAAATGQFINIDAAQIVSGQVDTARLNALEIAAETGQFINIEADQITGIGAGFREVVTEEMWSALNVTDRLIANEAFVRDFVADTGFIGELELHTLTFGQEDGRRAQLDADHGFRAWGDDGLLAAQLDTSGLRVEGHLSFREGQVDTQVGPYEGNVVHLDPETGEEYLRSQTVPSVRFTTAAGSIGAMAGWLDTVSDTRFLALQGPGTSAESTMLRLMDNSVQIRSSGSSEDAGVIFVRPGHASMSGAGPLESSLRAVVIATEDGTQMRGPGGLDAPLVFTDAENALIRGRGGDNGATPLVAATSTVAMIQGLGTIAVRGHVTITDSRTWMQAPGSGANRGHVILEDDVRIRGTSVNFSTTSGADVNLSSAGGAAFGSSGNSRFVATGNLSRIEGNALDSWATRDTPTTSSPNMVVNASSGRTGRSTSSRRYKIDPQPIPFEDAIAALNIEAQHWIDKPAADTYAAYLDGDEEADIEGSRRHDHRVPGFIAEDFHDAGLFEFVEYNEDGEVEGLAYDRIPALHHVLLQQQRTRIEELENENAALKDQYDTLAGRVAALEAA